MNRSSNPSDRHGLLQLTTVTVMIAVITLLHYGTMETKVHLHTVFRQLYFIPIVLIGSWYGLKAGLLSSLLITALYVPHVFMAWSAQPGVNIGNILETIVFVLVAAATGYLSDRERERHRQVLEAQNLAFLGKASLAITLELQEVINLLKELVMRTDASTGRGVNGVLQGVIDRITVLSQTLIRWKPEDPTRGRAFLEVDSAIERVRRKLGKLAQSRGVSVQTRLDPATGMLETNEVNFLQMIEELAKNAIENSEPGKTVTIVSRWFEDRCEIAVTDQGTGIAPENLSKIFVPFYSTKPKGTGLGLPVCKKLMKDIGGDIQVQGKPGEGSTFTLIFPRLSVQAAKATAGH